MESIGFKWRLFGVQFDRLFENWVGQYTQYCLVSLAKKGCYIYLKPRQTRMIGLVWNSSGCFERSITTSSYAILGKVWDGSIADEKDDYGYLAILAFSEDDSTRTSQVRILSNYAIHISLYSKHVINLWVELFNTQAQAW